MKRILSALLILCLLTALLPGAYAVTLSVGSTTVADKVSLYNGVTYVPLRATALLLCSGASVSWENGKAVIRAPGLTVSARPGDCYVDANGRKLFAKDGVRLVNGTTLIPVRVLAKAMDASVFWDGAAQKAILKSGSNSIESGDSYYNSDSVYWLSRIINAESGGEPLFGKIAVGNVILNRVNSPDFPDNIYDVIFDDVGGVQFTPVSNGTINNTPNAESVLAAKLCLDGASVVGGSLFFLNPAIATSSWIVRNCAFVATIGNHSFYA